MYRQVDYKESQAESTVMSSAKTAVSLFLRTRKIIADLALVGVLVLIVLHKASFVFASLQTLNQQIFKFSVQKMITFRKKPLKSGII